MSSEPCPKRMRVNEPQRLSQIVRVGTTGTVIEQSKHGTNMNTILDVIYENFARGILCIDNNWNSLDDDTIGELFDHLGRNERDKHTASLTRLVVQGNDMNGVALYRLLAFLKTVKTRNLRALHISTHVMWLLPCLVRLHSKWHSLEWRGGPVVMPDGEDGWCILHQALVTANAKHLRVVRLVQDTSAAATATTTTTTTTTTTNTATAGVQTNDMQEEDLDVVMMIPPLLNNAATKTKNPCLALIRKLQFLSEYHQVGDAQQCWTTAEVYQLLLHPTLRNVTIDVDLSSDEGQSWPCSADRALMRLPKRENPLRITLPRLSNEARAHLSKIVPYYVRVLPEVPLALSFAAMAVSPKHKLKEDKDSNQNDYIMMKSPSDIATQFWKQNNSRHGNDEEEEEEDDDDDDDENDFPMMREL